MGKNKQQKFYKQKDTPLSADTNEAAKPQTAPAKEVSRTNSTE